MPWIGSEVCFWGCRSIILSRHSRSWFLWQMSCQDLRLPRLFNSLHPSGRSNTGALLDCGYARTRSPRDTHSKQILGSHARPVYKLGLQTPATAAEAMRSLWLYQITGPLIVMSETHGTNLQSENLAATSIPLWTKTRSGPDHVPSVSFISRPWRHCRSSEVINVRTCPVEKCRSWCCLLYILVY